MNSVEFKRLALSDPYNDNEDFVRKSQECSESKQLLADIKKMDRELGKSLDVDVPESLMAKIQLTKLLEDEETERDSKSNVWRYATAACFAMALFVGGFLSSNLFQSNQPIGDDYQALLAGVVEHMDEVLVTPVWNPQRANQSANMHLANYDGAMKLKFLKNLQFSRLCPMGEYRGLHAGLDTPHGHVTFAYIKGDKVDDIIDAVYKGYTTRVKPLKDGNLVIVSKTKSGLDQASKQLDEALHWEL